MRTLYAEQMGSLRRVGIAAALTLAAAVGAAGQPLAPELRVENPGMHPALEARLQQVDTGHLRTIVRLVGLDDPGAPIHVVLVPENSAAARATPSWIAGFAHGATDTIVLFPSRSPRYPHDSLEAVVHHEVAHILINRAARGQPLPRWFNEGLATVAERARTFEDRRQLAWALAAGAPHPLHDLDRMFGEGAGQAARAYALSGAFVRDIIDQRGIEAPARMLELVSREVPFDQAFVRVAGESLVEAERTFHSRIATWERWVPLATSPIVLWTATTIVALQAIWVARRRRAERRRRWDEEERSDEGHEDS